MDNRYARYSTPRLPKTPRSRAIYGERDEKGKMYRCRFCGWICHVDKNVLGDGSGLKLLDAPLQSTGDRPTANSYYGGTTTHTETVTVDSTEYIKTVSGEFLGTVSGHKLLVGAGSSSWSATITTVTIDRIDPEVIIVVRTPNDIVLVDSDDDITEYEHNHYTVAASGCPLCGSRNYM